MGVWKIILVSCAGILFVLSMTCPVLAGGSLEDNELSSLHADKRNLAGETGDYASISSDLIDDSISGNRGIVSVNQSSGSLNNQSNVRALGSGGLGTFASTSNEIGENRVEISKTTRMDVISDSVKANVGIIGINQAAGNCNQQSNVFVMPLGGGAALNDAELTTISTGQENEIPEIIGDRMDLINNSFTDTRGVVQITQSAGDGNILRNRMAISFSSEVIK